MEILQRKLGLSTPWGAHNFEHQSRRTIFRVKYVLPSGILLLKGKDGQECREYFKNYAPSYLSIEGTLHPELAVVSEGLSCFVCIKKKYAATMSLYEICQQGWHVTCLTPPLITTFMWLGLSLMSELLGIWYVYGQVLMISMRQINYCHNDNIVILVD